jgi:hypothetical protein
MKKQAKVRHIKHNIYRYLTLFLFIPLLVNLIGNFIGISGHFTYYHFGYNAIAIASRYIENTILNIGWRIFLLGMTTVLSSGLMYGLYVAARKGYVFALVLGILLYIVDAFLSLSPLYFESTQGVNITNFIHLVMFAMLFMMILLYLLINPERRKSYDYA